MDRLGVAAVAAALFLSTPPAVISFAPCCPTSSCRSFLPRSVVSMSTAGGDATPTSQKNLVVISPPGGVGEVTAVEAAKRGGSVRWFVVSPPDSSSSNVALSEETISSITAAGGAVELAGADAPSLLLPVEDPDSALGAVGRWFGQSDGIIAVLDGAKVVVTKTKPDGREEDVDYTGDIVDAIKVTTKEAAMRLGVGGVRLEIIPAEGVDSMVPDDEDDGGVGVGGVLQSLLGKETSSVPETLAEALATGGSSDRVTTLRYGELFGTPITSPICSPFKGGPRRQAVLRDEYVNRAVRIDPAVSTSGYALVTSSEARSSRLSLGEAAARIALRSLTVPDGIDVCLSSQRGEDLLSDDEWEAEFDRASDALESGVASQLFNAPFASVPDKERLTDWIATKWAPAVLRTYDIAGIRVGGRPVFASKTGAGTVEIVWQDLVDFQSVTVGRMIVEVRDTEMIATRGPGDASAGFGSVSAKPLPGEDVLVRRLADAASQAVQKGLAEKAILAKKPKPEPVKEIAIPVVASTVAASGTVETTTAPTPASTETGPRSGGARRSSERSRGKRRKSAPPSSGGDDEPGSTPPSVFE